MNILDIIVLGLALEAFILGFIMVVFIIIKVMKDIKETNKRIKMNEEYKKQQELKEKLEQEQEATKRYVVLARELFRMKFFMED